jgi:hypothetical protein
MGTAILIGAVHRPAPHCKLLPPPYMSQVASAKKKRASKGGL